MLFNSYIFIFLFIPIVLSGWYGLNRAKQYRGAMLFLTAMSLWFYGYFNYYYLLIILLSIAVNYLISYLMKYNDSPKSNLMGLLFGVFFNLGILFYFKYYDFFIENINSIFKTDFSLKHILLPLGISFFTFQQLSYIIDRYRHKAKHYDLLQYSTFVTFFPQLVAGPIVLYDEMMPQFEDLERRKFNIESFARGYILFSIGLSKKVLLADVLANVVNYGFDNYIFLDSISTFVVGLAYTLELYFDFSGYSDMAMGLGKMLNIDLPQNFKSPYKACSMKQLWRWWHITLSRFFVQYVYIPLGGNRKGQARKLLNVFIIFALSGLWHGASWTFVVWGVLSGIAVVWDNLNIIGVAGQGEKEEPKIKIPKLFGQFLTFNYFMFSFYFFRADKVSDAAKMIRKVFSFDYTGSIRRLLPYVEIPEIYVVKQAISLTRPEYTDTLLLIVLLVLIAISIFVITRKNALEIASAVNIKPVVFVCATLLMFWSVISFSQVSTFIYFNF